MQAQRHLYQYMSYSMVCGTAKGKEQTMSKYIDADLYVEMQIYDDEHEEWGKWQGTIEDLLNQWTEQGCPSTIEVSEDCISREWVKGICENMLDEEMLGHMLGYIEDAPSVVPKRSCYRCGLREDCEDSTERKPKEGVWMPRFYQGIDKLLYECSNCHTLHVIANYCPNCGAKMKG